jgi:hypothetical protein
MNYLKQIRKRSALYLTVANVIITTVTLARVASLEPQHPQYFCTMPSPGLVVCNPG